MIDPVRYVLKGLVIGDRIHKDDPCGPLVVSLRNGLESFLSSSIPNLHFDVDFIDGDDFDFEINTDGGDVVHFVLIVDVSEKDVGFAD